MKKFLSKGLLLSSLFLNMAINAGAGEPGSVNLDSFAVKLEAIPMMKVGNTYEIYSPQKGNTRILVYQGRGALNNLDTTDVNLNSSTGDENINYNFKQRNANGTVDDIALTGAGLKARRIKDITPVAAVAAKPAVAAASLASAYPLMIQGHTYRIESPDKIRTVTYLGKGNQNDSIKGVDGQYNPNPVLLDQSKNDPSMHYFFKLFDPVSKGYILYQLSEPGLKARTIHDITHENTGIVSQASTASTSSSAASSASAQQMSPEIARILKAQREFQTLSANDFKKLGEWERNQKKEESASASAASAASSSSTASSASAQQISPEIARILKAEAEFQTLSANDYKKLMEWRRNQNKEESASASAASAASSSSTDSSASAHEENDPAQFIVKSDPYSPRKSSLKKGDSPRKDQRISFGVNQVKLIPTLAES